MSSARDIVERFHTAAFREKNHTEARSYLTDDLMFQGPIDTFTSADAYVEALKHLAPVVASVHVKHVFADGDDVCLLWEMETNTPIGTAFIAEWFHVTDDKIDRARAVFDARPFAAMFAS